MNDPVKASTAAVYIVEQQPFDYTPATTYGRLVFLDTQRLAPAAPNAPDTWNRQVLHGIRRDLSGYVPGYDYIVPTGAPARMLVVGMVLAEKGKMHRMLGWDNRQRRYLEYIITL